MRGALVLGLLAGIAVLPSVASAENRPGEFHFEFTLSVPPGAGDPIEILDNGFQWFLLTLTLAPPNPDDEILYLELEIAGLSHTAPQDLNFILLDFYGHGIEVMDDAGDGFDVEDVDLIFTDFGDKAIPLPHGPGEGALQPYPETIYLPDGPEAFTDYLGHPVGVAPWILVVIDDAEDDTGSFESATLRGLVPEPATLSLLVLGAFAMLRRRRR